MNQLIEEKGQGQLKMSMRLQVKGEMNMFLKNCLECVSLELSEKTDYVTGITKFLHREVGGPYGHWKIKQHTCLELSLSNA